MRTLLLPTIAAVVAACGSHHAGSGGDARDGTGDDAPDMDGEGPVDAAVDVPIDADPNVRGMVTVHVVDKNDAALAGLNVRFVDTDSTITDTTTDGAGTVTASVYPGASVTVLRARDTGLGFSLTTVLALNPDDDITLVSADGAVSTTQDPMAQQAIPLSSADILTVTKSSTTGTYTTHAPHDLAVGDKVVIAGVLSDPSFNGTKTVATTPSSTSFTVNLGGGGATDSTTAAGTASKAFSYSVTFPANGSATSYEVHTPCGPVDVGSSTTATLTLQANCATSGDILVFAKTSVTNEIAFARLANVTFSPGGSASVTDTWHSVSSIVSTYSNPTTRVTDVQLDRYTPYVRGNAPETASGSTTGGNVVLTFGAATPPVAWMRTTLTCPSGAGAGCLSIANGTAEQTITHKLDGSQTTYSLDIGANLLPWITALYEPPSTQMTITQVGAGAFDIFEMSLRYTRGQAIYTWRVFGPVAQTFKFPALPSSWPGDPTIRPTDPQSAYGASLCESDAVAGYRDAIKNPYRAIGTCDASSDPKVRVYGGTINRMSKWN